MNPSADHKLPDGVRYIASDEELSRLAADLAGAGTVALDTEAASFHRYWDRIYLIQVSTADWTAIVDPLPIDDLAPVGQLLADGQVEVVFHDADYDLRLFHQQHGYRAQGLFDTRVAAQLLGEPGVGLAALLNKYCGVKLDKRFQRADWSSRPLSPAMLAYASEDTAHLIRLRDILSDKLNGLSRLAWAEEEFKLLEGVEWVPREEDPLAYLRLKGAKALNPRSKGILRELFRWREKTAKRIDRAAFRVMNNQTLVDLARKPPTTVDGLKTVRGVGQEAWRRWGKSIVSAIERGSKADPRSLAPAERPRARKPDPAVEERLQRLKVRRNAIARRLELEPGVTCPNGTLEAIAREQPESLKALGNVPGVRRWQVGEFGDELLAELSSG